MNRGWSTWSLGAVLLAIIFCAASLVCAAEKPKLLVYSAEVNPDGLSWSAPCNVWWKEFREDPELRASLLARFDVQAVYVTSHQFSAAWRGIKKLPTFVRCDTQQTLTEYAGKADLLARLGLSLIRSIPESRLPGGESAAAAGPRDVDQRFDGLQSRLNSHVTETEQRFGELRSKTQQLQSRLDQADVDFGNAIAGMELTRNQVSEFERKIESAKAGAVEQMRTEIRDKVLPWLIEKAAARAGEQLLGKLRSSAPTAPTPVAVTSAGGWLSTIGGTIGGVTFGPLGMMLGGVALPALGALGMRLWNRRQQRQQQAGSGVPAETFPTPAAAASSAAAESEQAAGGRHD